MTLYTGARSRVVNGGENLGRLTFFEAVRYASSAPLEGEVVLLTNADIRVEAGFRARIFFFGHASGGMPRGLWRSEGS